MYEPAGGFIYLFSSLLISKNLGIKENIKNSNCATLWHKICFIKDSNEINLHYSVLKTQDCEI